MTELGLFESLFLNVYSLFNMSPFVMHTNQILKLKRASSSFGTKPFTQLNCWVMTSLGICVWITTCPSIICPW